MTTNQILRDALEDCLSSLTYMDRHFNVVDCTEEIEKARAALATADADQAPDAFAWIIVRDSTGEHDGGEPITDKAQADAYMENSCLPGWHLESLYRTSRPAPVGAVPVPTVGWLVEWTSAGGIKGEAFHRHNCVADYRAMYGEATACELVRGAAAPAAPIGACHCEACEPNEPFRSRMILCATCGNKRCPHATDHRNACTNSNEPGQVGSSYAKCAAEHAKPAAQTGAAPSETRMDTHSQPLPADSAEHAKPEPVEQAKLAEGAEAAFEHHISGLTLDKDDLQFAGDIWAAAWDAAVWAAKGQLVGPIDARCSSCAAKGGAEP